ncbi:hypothetical protein N7462_004994 [Penicillium macrosclerotiorum]|uniref:uncharacterized protein n=1 Tax=Penicillium macrosclerotiorum TaxID=303699 RepID=UPI002548C545|nr:uncharacterized protein N7462_004994 [Penicillium macrosclerotiorum]KAJ5690602.1 hypothetical protein N7462_004994 [Penicillium macrosclerotiorum]
MAHYMTMQAEGYTRAKHLIQSVYRKGLSWASACGVDSGSQDDEGERNFSCRQPHERVARV